jgi:Skp family chaperone for outer membrane proteins
MKAIQLLTATAALAVVAATAHSASAAAAAPAAAPRPAAAAAPAAPAAGSVALTPPPGAPVHGMCVFSLERAIGESTVGKAFNARMQQITAQAEAELAPERTALQTEATTLQGQQASLAADAFQQRATALNQRIQAYSAKEDLRSREIDATQQKNLQRIAVEVNPLLAGVYTTRRCAVVFTAEALINVNPAMDISDDVVKSLNGKMTTIAFDRERLDQQAAPAAAPAAAARPR